MHKCWNLKLQRWRKVSHLGTLFLVVPWLVPFSPGPAAAVVPWLTSAVCISFFILLKRDAGAAEVTTGWLAAALISSIFAGFQYFGLAQEFSPWINNTDKGVAFANLRQRNQFATLTNVGLVALWCFASAQRSTWTRNYAVLGLAALLGVGNAASSSRTGLVELLVLVLILGRWSRRTTAAQHVLLVAIVSYAIAGLALPSLSGLEPGSTGAFARFSDDAPACASRLVLWKNVLQLIALRPWFGWGWGELDYAHYITLYEGPRFCDILDNAHNLPLHLAVELGLPLAILACTSLLLMIVRLNPWYEKDAFRQTAWAVLFLLGLHSLLEYPLWYGPFQIALGLCISLLCRKPNPKINGSVPLLRNALVGVSGMVLLACSYAFWDYYRISQIYLPPDQRAPAYRDTTLEKIRGSWLFRSQVQFAELTTSKLTPKNAAELNRMANALLHFSPEPRVIEKVIESAVMLGRDDEVRFHLIRYRAAFPEAHAKWAATFMLTPLQQTQ